RVPRRARSHARPAARDLPARASRGRGPRCIPRAAAPRRRLARPRVVVRPALLRLPAPRPAQPPSGGTAARGVRGAPARIDGPARQAPVREPIDHLDLVVSDMERSLDFYRGLLAPLGYVGESMIEGERGE